MFGNVHNNHFPLRINFAIPLKSILVLTLATSSISCSKLSTCLVKMLAHGFPSSATWFLCDCDLALLPGLLQEGSVLIIMVG